jgi:hypothetical protein
MLSIKYLSFKLVLNSLSWLILWGNKETNWECPIQLNNVVTKMNCETDLVNPQKHLKLHLSNRNVFPLLYVRTRNLIFVSFPFESKIMRRISLPFSNEENMQIVLKVGNAEIKLTLFHSFKWSWCHLQFTFCRLMNFLINSTKKNLILQWKPLNAIMVNVVLWFIWPNYPNLQLTSYLYNVSMT